MEKMRDFVDVRPGACRHCGEALASEDPHPRRYQTAEILPVQPDVTEYRLHRLSCPHCGGRTAAAPPQPVFGLRLQAVLSLLAGTYRLGKRQVQAAAYDLLGLEISLGRICKLEQRTAAALPQPVEELQESVRTKPAGLDETGWRENGRKAWLQVLDEIFTEFQWANQNRREAESSPAIPVHRVTSMPLDPTAPDWAERLNQSLPAEVSADDPDAAETEPVSPPTKSDRLF